MYKKPKGPRRGLYCWKLTAPHHFEVVQPLPTANIITIGGTVEPWPILITDVRLQNLALVMGDFLQSTQIPHSALECSKLSNCSMPLHFVRAVIRWLAADLNPCSHLQFNICSRFYGTPLNQGATLDRVILKRPIRCLIIRPSHCIVLFPSLL